MLDRLREQLSELSSDGMHASSNLLSMRTQKSEYTSYNFLYVSTLTEIYTGKNLTSCSKSANKPSTSCVSTACPNLSTRLGQAVNNL